MKHALRHFALAALTLAGAAILGMAGSRPALAGFATANLSNDCQYYSNGNSNYTCGIQIDVTSSTSANVTLQLIQNATIGDGQIEAYDSLGGGDYIVGVANHSGSTLLSFDLTYPNAPFTLDADGACTISNQLAGRIPNDLTGFEIKCGATGSEGPGVYFTNLPGNPAGTVNFTGGLPNGDEAFFSVDDEIQVSNIRTATTAPVVATPEPMSLLVFCAALAGFGLMRHRRSSQAGFY